MPHPVSDTTQTSALGIQLLVSLIVKWPADVLSAWGRTLPEAPVRVKWRFSGSFSELLEATGEAKWTSRPRTEAHPWSAPTLAVGGPRGRISLPGRATVLRLCSLSGDPLRMTPRAPASREAFFLRAIIIRFTCKHNRRNQRVCFQLGGELSRKPLFV
jgi:hypothetical protein